MENVSCSDPEYATYEFARVRLVWKTFKALTVIYIRSNFKDQKKVLLRNEYPECR